MQQLNLQLATTVSSIIRHRFEKHRVRPETEILIVGTFNPETPNNNADFFYSRGRNYLWTLLPTCFQSDDLRGADKNQKLQFTATNRIDFADLIMAIDADAGSEDDYSDAYIDGRVAEWRDIITLIRSLRELRRVFVTRKTFLDVPKIRDHVEQIKKHCLMGDIAFQCLPTPARYYSSAKQSDWVAAFRTSK